MTESVLSTLPDDILWEVCTRLSPAENVAFAVARGDRAAVDLQVRDLAMQTTGLATELFRIIDLRTREEIKAYARSVGFVYDKTDVDELSFYRGYPNLVDASLLASFTYKTSTGDAIDAELSFHPHQRHDEAGFHSSAVLSAHSVSFDRDFPAELALAVMRAAWQRR